MCKRIGLKRNHLLSCRDFAKPDLLAERVSQCTRDMTKGSNSWRETGSAALAKLSRTGNSFCMRVWNWVGGASKSASLDPSGRRAFTPAAGASMYGCPNRKIRVCG